MRDNHRHGVQAPGLAAPQPAALDVEGLTVGHKDEDPGRAPEVSKVQTQTDSHDCAETGADDKRFATLQARLALRGFALTRTPIADSPGVYTVVRWGLMRELASLEDVAAFAGRVGARV